MVLQGDYVFENHYESILFRFSVQLKERFEFPEISQITISSPNPLNSSQLMDYKPTNEKQFTCMLMLQY